MTLHRQDNWRREILAALALDGDDLDVREIADAIDWPYGYRNLEERLQRLASDGYVTHHLLSQPVPGNPGVVWLITPKGEELLRPHLVGAPVPQAALRLVGTDGNAFSVLGRAIRAARAASWTQDQIDEYRARATSGDYNHLLAVTMEYFDVR